MMSQKNEIQLTPNETDIRAHLDFLFSDLKEYAKDGRFEVNQLVSGENYPVSDIDKAASDAIKKNKGVSVYVVPSLLDPEVPPFGRSGNDDFYASGVVWCDIDDPHDPDKLKALYAHCRPNRAVITATHPHRRIQLWWKLSEPLSDSATLLDALTGVMQHLGGDAKVTKVCQPMRLGGSVNYPSSDKLAKGRVVEQTKYVAIHDDAVDIDNFLKAYPVKDYKQLGEIINTNTGIEYSPVSGGLNVEEVITDGRETYAYKMVFASIVNFTRQNGCFPSAQDVFDDVWPVYSRKVSSRSGDLEKDGRGKKMLAQKIKSKLRVFENGGMARYGLGSLEEIIASKPAIQTIEKRLEKAGVEPVKNNNRGRFYFDNAPDIGINLDVNDFVQGLLTENTMSVVYGASNCGKTFFMSDLSFHVAQGKQWRGRRVEKGNVMYLSLEGQRGIDNRINAYKKEHGVDIDGFLRVPCPIDFASSESEDIPLFIKFIQEANNQFDNKIKLIVIDTLARALGGGDENSGVDMGLLVKHADSIREHTNAHICFIHHSGKDESKKARGHSSLRAAVDTEIEISRKDGDDYSSIKIQKQRDMDIGDDMQFKLKRVVLGVNKYGEEVTSCVVEPYSVSDDIEARINKRAQKPSVKLAYDATIDCIDRLGIVRHTESLPRVKTITYEEFKAGLAKRGIIEEGTAGARSIASRTRRELSEAGLIVSLDDYIWLKE